MGVSPETLRRRYPDARRRERHARLVAQIHAQGITVEDAARYADAEIERDRAAAEKRAATRRERVEAVRARARAAGAEEREYMRRRRNAALLRVSDRIPRGVRGVYVIRGRSGVVLSKIGRSSDVAGRLRSHALAGIPEIASDLVLSRLIVCDVGMDRPLEALLHWIFRAGRIAGTEVFRDIPGCVPEQFCSPADVFDYASALVRRQR
jgi:hypothetical protein